MKRLILNGYREQVGDFHALAGWRMTLIERRPSAAMYDCLDTDFDLVRIAARMLRANLVEVTWEDGQVQLETIVEGVGNPAAIIGLAARLGTSSRTLSGSIQLHTKRGKLK